MFRPKPVEPLKLQVGSLQDIYVSAALRMLSNHEPFRTYSLAVMTNAILEQLRHQANVMGIRGGRLVAYGGWIRVHRSDAEAWRQGAKTELPATAWETGDALISTIIAADDPADLPVLLRGISDRCRGIPVYRVRVFADGHERKRVPLTGRAQESLRG